MESILGPASQVGLGHVGVGLGLKTDIDLLFDGVTHLVMPVSMSLYEFVLRL